MREIITRWYAHEEGRQHWVQIEKKSLRLEHSSDTICELVGGGYTEIITGEDSMILNEFEQLRSWFTAEECIDMLTLARTLSIIRPEDLKQLSDFFYQCYDTEYSKVLARVLNEI